MKPGMQFSVSVEGTVVKVVYTAHMVDRYELPRHPQLPAAKKRLSEQRVRSMLEEAMPTIVDCMGQSDAIQGIIKSKSTKANLSFSASKRKGGGVLLVVKNVIVKAGYHAGSVRDYVVDVNPRIMVHFVKGTQKRLREEVLRELVPLAKQLKSGSSYHLKGDLVHYWVERGGNRYYVDEAGWLYDMYEFTVA